MMAEIEYFVHPNKKQNHKKFSSVVDLIVTLYPSANQMSGQPSIQITLGDAIKQVSFIRFASQSKPYLFIGFNS